MRHDTKMVTRMEVWDAESMDIIRNIELWVNRASGKLIITFRGSIRVTGISGNIYLRSISTVEIQKTRGVDVFHAFKMDSIEITVTIED